MTKIAILSTTMGPYALLGEDGVRGAKLALAEHNYTAGGEPIELLEKGTDATPQLTLSILDELLAEDVKLFLGPLSGNEALAVRQFGRNHPDLTFVNGSSASQPMFNPAPNFFTFIPTGAQLMMGLGKYVYEKRGFRRVVTIGEAYSFPYAQIGGFAHDFINSGGEVEKYLWCALATQDYRSLIEQIPDDIDAVYSSLGGTDGIHFLEQFRELRSDTPLIAGSIFADQSLLSSIPQYGDLVKGVVSASTHGDDIDTPEWHEFANTYREMYPDGFYGPSFFAYSYYINMKALLVGLDAVNGDLSKLQDTLQTLELQTPIGTVKLDHYRIAVTDIFINEIQQLEDGTLYTHMLERVKQVNSTLGMSDEVYQTVGDFSHDRMPGMAKKLLSFDEIMRAKRKNK
ncbi:MAG: ABC transporter substrate-binding protein [Phototrophicaceae bacterium]